MRYALIIISFIISSPLIGQTKRLVAPESIDTIMVFEEHTLYLKPSASVKIEPYYMPRMLVDSLTKGIRNASRRSLALEPHLQQRFKGKFKREGNDLFVRLDNGKWFKPPLNTQYDEVAYTFEYYFEDHGFFSIRVQWGEGNAYKLINAKTGTMIDIIGRPYFSPKGTYVLAIGFDIEAEYSDNGFQLLHNTSNGLIEVGRYNPRSWGCIDLTWISENKLILKNQSMEFPDSGFKYFNFFTELEIKR